MVKVMTIEALLTWAFAKELCKGGADGGGSWAKSSSDMIAEMVDMGVMIDRSPNGYGVIADLSSEGEPHADAVIVGEVVQALAGQTFPVPDAPLFPEFADPHGLIAAEVENARHELRQRGEAATARHVMTMVIAAAILGQGPDGACEPPRFRMIEKYGKPAWFVVRRMRGLSGEVYTYENEGYDAAKGRPKPRAYRKWRLAEPLRGTVMARIDRLWCKEALERVSAALDGRLSAHRLVIGGIAVADGFATVDGVAASH